MGNIHGERGKAGPPGYPKTTFIFSFQGSVSVGKSLDEE